MSLLKETGVWAFNGVTPVLKLTADKTQMTQAKTATSKSTSSQPSG
jgi:hypothetical protein